MRVKWIRICAVAIVSLMALGGSVRAEAPVDAGGASAGVDLTFFKMYAANGAGHRNADGVTDDYFHDSGFRGEGRYWFGYEMESGLGLRARIFEWESSQVYSGVATTQDFEIFDVEATLRSQIHEWELLGIGGVRWGSVELMGLDFLEPNPSDFDGAGMTIGGEVRRALLGNTSIVAGARYSLLYGETSFQPASTAVLEDTTLDITEVKLGLEWSRMTRFGGVLTASATWEHQAYGTDTYYPNAIDPESPGDVTLAGPVFSISYQR